jgi:alpha-tubulin suppressor-like RCC1 family protein
VLGPGSTGGFDQVAAGDDFACARHGDGSVVCWGFNEDGMLATTDTSIRSSPNPVTLAADAVQLVAKYRVVCALLIDSTLWCWGDNWEGQAGQDEQPPYNDALSPLPVPGSDWRAVATGQGHVCGIRNTGALWCWGRNIQGELGLGTNQPGQIRTPTQVGSDLNWKGVYGGAFHTCAIRDDDSLWCWGSNASYQLGIDDTTNPKMAPTQVGTGTDWMTVSLSPFHACGLRQPGTLWCWGRNDEGQLGLPWSADPTRVPTQIGSDTDWVEVSGGWMHTCARRADDSVWCTGENVDGRVGDGSTARPYAFVAVDPFP